jgi:hypothetical protein
MVIAEERGDDNKIDLDEAVNKFSKLKSKNYNLEYHN